MLYFVYPMEQNTHLFKLQLMDYIGGWRKFHSLSAFLLLFWWQKDSFLRALLTWTFIRLLLTSFDLRCYSSKSRKIMWDVMLLIFLELLREGFFCFPVRDWEAVCRKLLSLVFLNFQLQAKMLNFKFIKSHGNWVIWGD